MEIRVLRYFLEIAREGSMTAAAEVLHVSQSALSKQMKELEDELGKKLFRRGSRSMSLTEEGILLRRRTEDILDMVDKTTEEFRAIDDLQGGDVYLGCAESHLIAHIARKIKHFKERYPLFHYHIISGDRTVVSCCRRKDCAFDERDVVDCSSTNGIEPPQEAHFKTVLPKSAT